MSLAVLSCCEMTRVPSLTLWFGFGFVNTWRVEMRFGIRRTYSLLVVIRLTEEGEGMKRETNVTEFTAPTTSDDVDHFG